MNGWVEIVGYIGSGLVVLSLAQRSILRLRVIGLVGSLTFLAYSLLIEAYPVAIVNSIAAAIHAFYLRKLISRPQAVFSTLAVQPDSAYLRRFLEFHEADIARYQPEFTAHLTDDLHSTLLLRDMVPAGLVLYREEEFGVKIVLDYAIPEYRDFKLGSYLFSEQSGVFSAGTRLWSLASTPEHGRYLERMCFTETGHNRFEMTVTSGSRPAGRSSR